MKRKLQENLKRVQQRINDACARAGRLPTEVTLVAVTKYAGVECIRALIECGHTVIGESRVQELAQRAAMIEEWLGRRPRDAAPPSKPHWHLVGHLQRNKVKTILPWVELIHSVDSLRLVEEIDAQAARAGKVAAVLVEVNAGGESAKQGLSVPAVTHFVEQVQGLRHVSVRGLMTMAPLTDDADRIRHTFERMHDLFEEVISRRLAGSAFRELSMGMSNDFEHAIEFGATMVRIGTALFEGIELTASTAEPADNG